MPRPKSKRTQDKIKAYAEEPESECSNLKALKGSDYNS